jgi:hypothetical protein
MTEAESILETVVCNGDATRNIDKDIFTLVRTPNLKSAVIIQNKIFFSTIWILELFVSSSNSREDFCFF